MPGISEIVNGTAIAASALPTGKERRFYDRGPHMMDLLHKRAEDTLDYWMDLRRWLEPTEVVTAAQAYSDPLELEVARLQFAPTGLVLWLRGGGDGVRQTVFCRIWTSRENIKLFRFVVLTRGVALGTFSIVSDDGDTVVGGDGDTILGG